jgi:hypothetical protein
MIRRALVLFLTLGGIALPFAVYWLGGGDFERTPMLAFAAIMSPVCGGLAYSFAILFDAL